MFKLKKQIRNITALGLISVFTLGQTEVLLAAEPVRLAFEAAGGAVNWDSENALIIIEIEGSNIVLTPGSATALVNGESVSLSQPVTIENGTSFIDMADLTTISFALLGIEQSEGKHSLSIATAEVMAAQLMEAIPIPDFSFAIVNANTGFSFATTMSDETNADTIFHLGSIGKTFTAVAVMQLVEQGLLDLDTPIIYYLPEFSALPSANGEGNYRNITARMLLSHTSGIYINDMGSGAITYGGHYESYMNNFLTRFSNTRMVREEGTSFEYANNGFVILGILVAHITGHDNYFEGFNKYMLENVFEPMGLTRTSFVMTEQLLPYVARPYTMTNMPQTFQYWNQLPTGTLFTTANEAVSLMTLFLNDGTYNGNIILTPESVELMFTDQTGTGNYGLGIMFLTANSGNMIVGHNGAMIYNFAAMLIDRENGLGVFSATNSTVSQGFNEALADTVLVTAIGEIGGTIVDAVSHLDPDATQITLTEEELEELTGLYILGMVHAFVELVDGALYLRVPTQGLNVALVPMSDGHFATELGIPFWLIPDDEGNVNFVQGENRYSVVGTRVDSEQFIPNEDFMENWNGFTFEAVRDEDFYVIIIPSMTFGVTEEGFAYSSPFIINVFPGTEVVILESMDSDIVLQYENGEYFFYYFGLRFVRQ